MAVFLGQFFALIPNLRSDLASGGSLCPQSASKDRQFGLAARRDLHYVRARRCDARLARAEPWHAMHQNVTMYTAVLFLKRTMIVQIILNYKCTHIETEFDPGFLPCRQPLVRPLPAIL